MKVRGGLWWREVPFLEGYPNVNKARPILSSPRYNVALRQPLTTSKARQHFNATLNAYLQSKLLHSESLTHSQQLWHTDTLFKVGMSKPLTLLRIT